MLTIVLNIVKELNIPISIVSSGLPLQSHIRPDRSPYLADPLLSFLFVAFTSSSLSALPPSLLHFSINPIVILFLEQKEITFYLLQYALTVDSLQSPSQQG